MRESVRVPRNRGREREVICFDWRQSSSSFSCHSVGAELCGPADLSTRPCDFCLWGKLDFSERVSHLSKICRWICVCVNLCVRRRIWPPVTRRCILRNKLPQVLSAVFLPDRTVVHRWLMGDTLCNWFPREIMSSLSLPSNAITNALHWISGLELKMRILYIFK